MSIWIVKVTVPPGSGTRMGIDRDEDGDLDFLDNCPSTPNGNQADGDNDGIANDSDNCPLIGNPEQDDLDGDLVGDPCDTDMDGDGLSNEIEIALGLDPKVAEIARRYLAVMGKKKKGDE